ncbi:U3-containing 90S pre-ribosomal complex subunit-domain containing protein [Gautieria morchelliformis]|nr:U3-containing 90S pre-ribosomal complex subunit-domain containing protein [Gautieria morchelliformis]
MVHGDDLEDDYIPDSDLVIVSGEEDRGSDEEEEEFEEFQGIAQDIDLQPLGVQGNQPISKKRKRREKEKAKKAKKRKLGIEPEEAQLPSAACLSPADAALYLSTQQAKALSKLSLLELEDRKIPASCMADTTTYSGPRTLDHIENFISQTSPPLLRRLSQTPRYNGAPTLIFIAGAALRVADVARALRKFRGDKGGVVAKLFARHFKLQDHIAYLKRTKVGVAVGTPARLGQLLEADALALTALTHIFLDTTYRDAKKRSIMDIPETRDEVFLSVLGRAHVRAALHSGKIQLVLF